MIGIKKTRYTSVLTYKHKMFAAEPQSDTKIWRANLTTQHTYERKKTQKTTVIYNYNFLIKNVFPSISLPYLK